MERLKKPNDVDAAAGIHRHFDRTGSNALIWREALWRGKGKARVGRVAQEGRSIGMGVIRERRPKEGDVAGGIEAHLQSRGLRGEQGDSGGGKSGAAVGRPREEYAANPQPCDVDGAFCVERHDRVGAAADGAREVDGLRQILPERGQRRNCHSEGEDGCTPDRWSEKILRAKHSDPFA